MIVIKDKLAEKKMLSVHYTFRLTLYNKKLNKDKDIFHYVSNMIKNTILFTLFERTNVVCYSGINILVLLERFYNFSLCNKIIFLPSYVNYFFLHSCSKK